MSAVKFQDELHICTPPGIDGLVGVPYHEQVLMITGEDIRKGVLVLIDVLKFVHHDVFQPILPLLPGVLVLLQDVERKVDKVVKVQTVALSLLIEVAVHDLIL